MCDMIGEKKSDLGSLYVPMMVGVRKSCFVHVCSSRLILCVGSEFFCLENLSPMNHRISQTSNSSQSCIQSSQCKPVYIHSSSTHIFCARPHRRETGRLASISYLQAAITELFRHVPWKRLFQARPSFTGRAASKSSQILFRVLLYCLAVYPIPVNHL